MEFDTRVKVATHGHLAETVRRPNPKETRWSALLPVLAGIAGMVAVGACGPGAESSSSYQESDLPQWREGEAWMVSFEPQVTVGVVDGPAEYEFFDVVAAARRSDGDIVVADGGAREVRLYDRDGSFVQTLGGPGAGPGEFQDPAQLVVLSGDSVLVWDNAYYRITRFDAAGELVGVRSVDFGRLMKAIDPPLYPATAKLLHNNELIVRLIEKTGKGSPPGTFRLRSGALRVSVDLSSIDTVTFFSDIEQVSVQAPWGRWPMVPPLARGTLTAVDVAGSRVCVGDQQEPEVVCFGPDGSRIAMRWSSNPGPVTEREIRAWRDATMEDYGMKLSEQQIAEMLAQVATPTEVPHFSSIVIDRLGNVWVERDQGNRAEGRAVEHFVFDASGSPFGSVVLPPIRVLEIGEDYVLGVYHDESDVAYVQVHALVKP